jgi:hypothetical protein
MQKCGAVRGMLIMPTYMKTVPLHYIIFRYKFGMGIDRQIDRCVRLILTVLKYYNEERVSFNTKNDTVLVVGYTLCCESCLCAYYS